MKYFPRDTGVKVNELEQDEKLASMIAAKNRTSEFFIQKAKLKNLNAIT